ncbi:MAG: hypothetical protein ABIO86_17290 [Sphingomonas sp.]
MTTHGSPALADKVDETTSPLDREEGLHKMTLEALAEVDAGAVIDHGAIQAWADSLMAPVR